MYQFDKEITPVLYGPSLVKIEHYRMEPESVCFRTHWHDRAELLYIRKGALWSGCEHEIQEVKAGEVLWIPPHMPHKGITKKEPVEYDVFMFDIRSFYNETDVCRELFSAVFDGRAVFQTIIKEPKLTACLEELKESREEGAGALGREAGIYRLLYLLFEYALLSYDKNCSVKQSFQKVIDYVEAHYAEELSTASLSVEFGYSEEHFCRKFKEATGLSLTHFVRILRLEKAYRLLKAGEHHIGRLAEECGYSDANYFTRCFKAHFGVPPSQFLCKLTVESP